MIDAINKGFLYIINLGAPPMMLIVFLIVGLIFGVSFSHSLESGIRLAVALTGMSAIISLLTTNFSPALQAFVKSTGINLSITDVGWPPLATITWASVLTLLFVAECLVVNIILLITKQVETLNVDIFNMWQISVLGLLIMYYGKNIIIASVWIIAVYIVCLKNADLIKPTLNDLLGYEKDNVATCAHINLIIAPFAMIIDKIIDKIFPFLDKYDFDAKKLNDKIGFWGSRFAIGAYLGIFIGLLGQQPIKSTLTLAFTGAVCLELLAFMGGWFGEAVEPISKGVSSMMQKRFSGRKLNIGIDWPFLGARPEVWAVANILAPIMLIIAMVLPGNKVLPLGGIILTGLTPALLIVSRGRVIRMIVEGTILLPLYLWTGTFIAKFITTQANKVGGFDSGVKAGNYFTSIEGGPVEKMIGHLIGTTTNVTTFMYAAVAVVAYLAVFVFYTKAMNKRNAKLQ